MRSAIALGVTAFSAAVFWLGWPYMYVVADSWLGTVGAIFGIVLWAAMALFAIRTAWNWARNLN